MWPNQPYRASCSSHLPRTPSIQWQLLHSLANVPILRCCFWWEPAGVGFTMYVCTVVICTPQLNETWKEVSAPPCHDKPCCILGKEGGAPPQAGYDRSFLFLVGLFARPKEGKKEGSHLHTFFFPSVTPPFPQPPPIDRLSSSCCRQAIGERAAASHQPRSSIENSDKGQDEQ